MKGYLNWLLLGTIAIAAMGCVSQSEHDKLKTAYFKEKEQVVDLRVRLDEAMARALAAQEAASPGSGDANSRFVQAVADREKLSHALADAEKRLRDAGLESTLLPTSLDAALKDLAAANPDLIAFDSKHGMLKISSDLTFDPGSTDVKAPAAAVLAKLAAIIKSPDADRYEALIVGHTDNVRIGKPETKAKHPSNWHLSVHRSIAVKDVLDKAGVPPARVCVAGYGMYRPVTPNGPKGDQLNRRVEIFLVPSTVTLIEPGKTVEAPTPEPAPEPAPTTPKPTTESPVAKPQAEPKPEDNQPEMFK